MVRKEKSISVSGMIMAILIIFNVITIKAGYTSSEHWYWVLIAAIPLLMLAVLNIRQKKGHHGQ
jgi:hypothetical protein